MALCYQDQQKWGEAEQAWRKAIAGDGEVPEMAFEHVACDLRRVLEEGRYRRGDRLPAEAVLAKPP